jgi:hypothetical protein
MTKYGIFILLAGLVLTGPAVAGIVQLIDVSLPDVYQIDDIAVRADYYSATAGQLVWSRGGVATLYHSSGSQKYRVAVNATWGDVTDLSDEGVAAASFATGNFSMTFYAMTDPGRQNPLGGLTGELYPGWTYNESETQENPSQLYGSAPIRLTSWSVPGLEWGESIGAMGGLTASTSNLFSAWGNISDYQSNWWSDNAIVTIVTDETGIPEPATMALLGLGAMALVSRKRSL